MMFPWRSLRWLVGAIVVLSPVAAAALEPHPTFKRYRHWAWPDVAHTSTVWSVTQAATGQLWIATREGLVQFDGRRLIPYDAIQIPGLVAREVTSVIEGRGGILWVGAREGGLFAVRLTGDGRGTIVGRTPGLVIRQMVEGPDGALWIAAHNGMARVAPGELTARMVSDGLPAIVASRVTIDAGGTPWAGTLRGAARWKGDSWHPVVGPNGSDSAADALAAEPDGTVWVGSRDAGLWRWRDGAWRVYTKSDGLPSDSFTSIIRDRAGHLWVASVGGELAWLDGDRFRALPTPASLCAGRILSMMEDREDGLWIATNGCGLHRIRSPLFGHLSGGEGEPHRHVAAVAMVDGSPWIATEGGLARWKDGRFHPIPCSPSPCGDCSGIAPTRGAEAWISCRDRPVQRGSVALVTLPTPPLPAGTQAVLEAVDGARWVDTGRDILRVTAGTTTPLAEAAGLTGKRILYEGRGGRIWIVASNRVLLWLRGAVTVFDTAALGPADPASAYEDAAGTLWMATRGSGLRHLQGDRVAQIDARHGLLTGWIAQIIDDGEHLWMSASRGLLRVSKAAVEEVVAGRRATLNVALFDAREGVALTDRPFFGTSAVMKAGDGQLWFATNDGVLVVNPAALRVAAPPVTIDQLRVGGRPLSPARAAAGAAAGPEDVELSFAAITFEAPETIATHHRLEGWDAQWIDGGAAAVARYDRLPAGRYRFRVRAVSRDGISVGPETTLALVLAPPWQRSPFFLVALAALLGASLLWAHRLRLGRARVGMRAVLAERARIARDLHDTLAQAFVATSVQLECIDKALEEGDVPGAQRHLVSARDVVTGSLDEARRAVWLLRPQAIEGGLPAALAAMVERVSGQPAVTFTLMGTARPLPAAAEAHLLRIAQEAVANGARHAQASAIRVQLEFRSAMVTLRIQDDGIGFAPGAGDPAVPHQGLTGMRERAAEMGARLSIDATDHGTTVRVELPL